MTSNCNHNCKANDSSPPHPFSPDQGKVIKMAKVNHRKQVKRGAIQGYKNSYLKYRAMMFARKDHKVALVISSSVKMSTLSVAAVKKQHSC